MKSSVPREMGNKLGEPYKCSSLLIEEFPGLGAGEGSQVDPSGLYKLRRQG